MVINNGFSAPTSPGGSQAMVFQNLGSPGGLGLRMTTSPPDAIPVNSLTDYTPPGDDLSNFEVGVHAGLNGYDTTIWITERCPACHNSHRLYQSPTINPTDQRSYVQFICYGRPGQPGITVQLKPVAGPVPADTFNLIAQGKVIGS
jgi:hypothetical protein